jgi:blue copper oxidase
MPNGIYGAATVTGMMGGTIPGYDQNPLNGADFGILQINVVAQTVNPVTTMPVTLVANNPWTGFTVSRNFQLQPDTLMNAQAQVAGPFNINGVHFDMNTINETVYLNTTEKWRITNQTGIAHPFHIHDIFFYILNVNGGPVPNYLRGKKDVVLVKPNQYVEFVTKFEDFANDTVPYMYHCHLLHHEDEGMMGSFRVIDTTTAGIAGILQQNDFLVYPNPGYDFLKIAVTDNHITSIVILNSIGGKVYEAETLRNAQLDIAAFPTGIYFIKLIADNAIYTSKFIKR